MGVPRPLSERGLVYSPPAAPLDGGGSAASYSSLYADVCL